MEEKQNLLPRSDPSDVVTTIRKTLHYSDTWQSLIYLSYPSSEET